MAEGLSKKQLKELRRLEKLQSRNLEQKSNSVKWIAIAVVSALFLVLFVGIVLVAKNKNNPDPSAQPAVLSSAGHERMVSLNESDATNSADQAQNVIQIVEYADIQCPACKTYHPMAKALIEAYPGRVKLLFKHFPLISIHPNAMPAAIAAEAAGRQDKFFEFVDLAYERQAEWSNGNALSKFEEYAKEIGLDIEKFKADQKDPAIEKSINDLRDEGIANGVTGTPTFFIEGERIKNPASLEEFKKLLEPKLNPTNSDDTTTNSPTTSTPDSLPLQQ